jgi:hypothetical protein
VRARAERHPNLTTWLLLAVGMVAVLAWSARDVGLAPPQWFWLATATVLVAGLCAWIISWEADAPDELDEAAERGEPAAADAMVATTGAGDGGPDAS